MPLILLPIPAIRRPSLYGPRRPKLGRYASQVSQKRTVSTTAWFAASRVMVSVITPRPSLPRPCLTILRPIPQSLTRLEQVLVRLVVRVAGESRALVVAEPGHAHPDHVLDHRPVAPVLFHRPALPDDGSAHRDVGSAPRCAALDHSLARVVQHRREAAVVLAHVLAGQSAGEVHRIVGVVEGPAFGLDDLEEDGLGPACAVRSFVLSLRWGQRPDLGFGQ